MVLFSTMILSFATGFADISSAEEITVDQDHVIPYVQPEKVPTIDGKLTSEDEWANALKITIDKDTDGVATSDLDDGSGTSPEVTGSSSMDAYVFYSANLDGFETDDDIMWDYIPGDDPIGGLFFHFEVKDTTQAFATGENGIGLNNSNAADCVQVALNGDPDHASSGLSGKEWLYTFTGYTAGAPGVGEIPSGHGGWYEHWVINGNAISHDEFNIKIKTSMDVDFDPAYPLPEGDLSIDDPGYKEWKKQRDDAFEHITNYRGYTIEAFIEWEACNYGEGMFILPIEGQKLGMGLILINYMYEWEGSGPVNTRQALVWGKTDIGGADAIWSDLSRPQLFPLYQLGSHDAEEPSEDKIVGIEVTAPTKVNYLVDEEFVEDGFAVQNVYQSGKKEATTGTYEAPDMSTVGDKVVEVTAGEFTSSFTIRVSNKGDINADGKVSLADVMTAAKTAIITDQDANSAEVVFGDIVGNDNKVTLADVLKLAKVSVGKDTLA